MSALLAAVAAALALWGYNGPRISVEVVDMEQRYVGWSFRDQADPNVCRVQFASGWESWISEYVLLVAIHEVGHCLGVEGAGSDGGHGSPHSGDPSSAMYHKLWSAEEQAIRAEDRFALIAARPSMPFRAVAPGIVR